jgi:nicotinamide riboside transporter PnuC
MRLIPSTWRGENISQWSGCITGIIGSCLLALNNEASGFGFVLFLASNLCWIKFAMLVRAPGMVVTQIAFMATSMLGIYRWLM